MNSPWLLLSAMFGIGGGVTFLLGRRLRGRVDLAWLIQVTGILLILASMVGIGVEFV